MSSAQKGLILRLLNGSARWALGPETIKNHEIGRLVGAAIPYAMDCARSIKQLDKPASLPLTLG